MIVVSGLINIETTLKIDSFPLQYNPVNYPFFGVNSTVSGVGYNVASALTALGDEVYFASMIGTGIPSRMVFAALEQAGINAKGVLPTLEETPQSVIIYDHEGQRQIHVDLKDLQETPYPAERLNTALQACEIAVLCNINFSRPFLQTARELGKLIATDVHEISDLESAYDGDFMAAADVLFMSGGSLPTTPLNWIRQVRERHGNEIIVIGLGEHGALLSVKSDDAIEHIPAVSTRPVVNTIGAGDALFSAFVHFYAQRRDPYDALRKATVFASYKIGERGAAEGFLSEVELLKLVEEVY